MVEGPEPTTSPSLLGASPADPAAPAVVESVGELRQHVDQTIAALADVAADDLSQQRAVAARASRALTANDAFGIGAEPHGRPLLPGPATDREEVIDWNDLLTDALRAGREVGGDQLLAVLSDPIAGDLGAWQRDPAGVYEAVQQVIHQATPDLEETEDLVATLDGQALRALAWTELASDAGSVEEAAALIERAIAHLSIVADALRALADDIEART
ncbi:MAG: hypothetical protein R3249_08255 [Nitriliruptorales bacterium]|nr:hypothetical protein [Nitriliruptorales bacterium]